MAIEIKTYDEILDELKLRITNKTGLPFPFNEGDVLTSLLEAVAVVLSDLYSNSLEVLRSYILDYATGDLLTLRGQEITIRRSATYATGKVRFTKSNEYLNTEVVIPAGTIVSVPPTTYQREIRFRTTQPVSIASGVSSGVADIVATEPGSIGNVSANTITRLDTFIPGIASVTNESPTGGGMDAETDAEYRNRIRQTLLGLSRATYPSVLNAPYQVKTSTGKVVKTASFVPIGGNRHYLVINDGTTWSPTPVSGSITYNTPPAPANVLTLPWYPTYGSVSVVKNGNTLTEGTDYWVVYTYKQVILAQKMTTGDTITVTANYYDDELIKLVSDLIAGDPNNPVDSPGYCPAGVNIIVKPASVIVQNVALSIVVGSGYDVDKVKQNVIDTLTQYLNSKEIGQPLYVAEIVDVVMEVEGVINCSVSSPSSTVLVGNDEVIRAGTITVNV